MPWQWFFLKSHTFRAASPERKSEKLKKAAAGKVCLKVVAVIPARYESVRFPGKVLAKKTGKYLIQHTYERALSAKIPSQVVIATDSELVMNACNEFGAPCVMTSREHPSGTDRINEAVREITAEIIVNVQGDEPEIEPANIDLLANLLIKNTECQMATLVAGFEKKEQVSDPNIVKVVVDKNGYAIYFSRSVIPYGRAEGGIADSGNYLRHLGIYAYRKEFLKTITTLPQGNLEKIEKLEQLRVLENGYRIMTGKVEKTCDGIDTAQQYAEFVNRYLKTSSD
jgi:3-deoxy-manno-octulosonate cytidylyltransferase (CMP-KDO synthetase)